jgi:hypothetical protein
LPDQLLKAALIELSGNAAECGIVFDAPRNVLGGDTEAQRLRTLVERGFRYELSKQLLVVADGTRLVRRQRTPKLTRKLLETVVENLAELVARDFRAANFRHGVLCYTAENIANAPNAEADDDHAKDGSHDQLAEPI